MQHRMKTYPLSPDQIDRLLVRALTGSLATINGDGSPYVTPVHYVYLDNSIYVHCLPKGTRLDNLKADPRVCLTIYEMDGLLLDPEGKPCDTNTKYQSIIISGEAALLDDVERKRDILAEIVRKYTPQLNSAALPDNMVKGTAVIRIQARSVTGKYYG